MTNLSLKEKLKALLRDSGLSQADLASMLGINRSSVNCWLSGKHVPSAVKLNQISEIFRIQLRWFRDEQAPYPPDDEYALTVAESSARSKEDDQAVEIVGSNLYRINDPEVRKLLANLEKVTRGENTRNIKSMVGKFLKVFSEYGSDKKPIRLHIIQRRGGEKK